MTITLIGTGNVANVMGRKLNAAGHTILQVFGRNPDSAKKLGKLVAAEAVTALNGLDKNADLYVIAVPDDAIAGLAERLQLENKMVVHTAASVPKDALQYSSDHFGVFYPLQSLRKEVEQLPDIPILVDASNEAGIVQLYKLARTISNKVFVADDNKRLRMHLAAVMANNFTNHLYVLAEEFCKNEGLDFSLLLPLIKETALRLEQSSPAMVQTGPAARNDRETIDKHLSLLQNHPALKTFYHLFTESIRFRLS